jgi:hypothetical protein
MAVLAKENEYHTDAFYARYIISKNKNPACQRIALSADILLLA